MGQQKSLFGQQQQQQQQQNSNIHQNLNSSISTGPPKQGLFDSLREEMNQVVQTPKKTILNQTQNQIVTSGYSQSFNDSYLNQSNFNTSR